MESALTKACTIKIQNFEGPFDLLFHLLEKNQVSIYDIPINDIADQYMDYLFAMQSMDLEIASEFLLMAATLLHIKSKMLLPEKREKNEEDVDPREELVLKLIEYKKYKEFSESLREREKNWEKVFYKLPEAIKFTWDDEVIDLSYEEMNRVYTELLQRNEKKLNKGAAKMVTILQHEKVSLKGKMREVLNYLMGKAFFKFTDFFSLKQKSKTEVVTGFLAILELAKLKRARLEQKNSFSDIVVYKGEDAANHAIDFEDELTAAGR